MMRPWHLCGTKRRRVIGRQAGREEARVFGGSVQELGRLLRGGEQSTELVMLIGLVC